MRKPIIGVMGPGSSATKQDTEFAFELGKAIAEHGWILLSGGKNEGVMNAVNLGAKSANGVTVGIIPTKDTSIVSEGVDIAIMTNMGSARNYINVLTCDVIIACGMEAGTASEVAMSLKEKKPVVLLTANTEGNVFFKKLQPELVFVVGSVGEAIVQVDAFLSESEHG